jgi:putative membrane protein
MKQLIGALALACAVCAAPIAQAQTPPASSPGTAKPGGTKPQGGTPATPPSGHAHGAAAPQGGPAAADAMFIRTAGMDGMAEVEHGRLAAQNAAHDDVKQFAQRMVDDHSRAADELKGLASTKNVTLPTTLDAKHKAMQDKLSKMKGAAFDRAYMAHMVTAHRQAVALFQKEATGGKDAEAKAWAAKTLPTLQEHLKLATTVNTKVASAPK